MDEESVLISGHDSGKPRTNDDMESVKSKARNEEKARERRRAVREKREQGIKEPKADTGTTDAEIAKKMSTIIQQHMEKINTVCSQITSNIDKADRNSKHDYVSEQQLVNDVKPLIKDGSRILEECNGAIRGLDPDGSIAARAKERARAGTATSEEHALASQLTDLTTSVVKTVDSGKKRLQDKPHAKKELDPMWALLTEPLFMILASAGLLVVGVLGLVGQLLSLIGLKGLVRGVLGGIGLEQLLKGLGLASITDALGIGKAK